MLRTLVFPFLFLAPISKRQFICCYLLSYFTKY